MINPLILILECIAVCFILLVPCVIAIANGVHNAAFLFEKDVQNRVVAMGLITEEQLSRIESKADELADQYCMDDTGNGRLETLHPQENADCEMADGHHWKPDHCGGVSRNHAAAFQIGIPSRSTH